VASRAISPTSAVLRQARCRDATSIEEEGIYIDTSAVSTRASFRKPALNDLLTRREIPRRAIRCRTSRPEGQIAANEKGRAEAQDGRALFGMERPSRLNEAVQDNGR